MMLPAGQTCTKTADRQIDTSITQSAINKVHIQQVWE